MPRFFSDQILRISTVILIFCAFICASSNPAHADEPAEKHSMAQMMGPEEFWQTQGQCGHMGVWDVGMAMCMPLAMPGMPMQMLMIHGYNFGGWNSESSARGRDRFFSTNMVMADLGSTLSDHHYLNVDLMLTAEKWSVPAGGYPLLLQIGEHDSSGRPYLDAQHPHSSPIMGLTLSDTYTLGHGKDNLKFFFAPRGETTDGPVAFMHRITGVVNPDAPLGHHIGQDVGHITSTVIGASLKLGDQRFEISGYHGMEPSPDSVDLPIGTPDSFSFRFIEEFSPSLMAMVSFARASNPEEDSPEIKFENRYSASLYYNRSFAEDWMFASTLIYGAVTQYDHAAVLSSLAEEFLFKGIAPRIFGRIEVLQRTPAELEIASSTPHDGKWVALFTGGYSHRIWGDHGMELAIGGSASKYLLPSDFTGAYQGDPWSGKVFLQLAGMKMWDF